jgi:hypothetical protein
LACDIDASIYWDPFFVLRNQAYSRVIANHGWIEEIARIPKFDCKMDESQMLLQARCAPINGELGKYIAWSPSESSPEKDAAP